MVKRYRAGIQPPTRTTSKTVTTTQTTTTPTKSQEQLSKEYAQYLLSRKLSGGRIVLDEDILRNKGYDPRIVKSEYRRLLSIPANRRELGRVAERKIETRELGYESETDRLRAERVQAVVRKPESTIITDAPAQQVQGYMFSDYEQPQTTQKFFNREFEVETKTLRYGNIEVQRNIPKDFSILDPFPSRETVGGRLIPKEDIQRLPIPQQKLLKFAQPETILAMTQYPTLKPVEVKFAGVKSNVQGDKTATYLRFKTSKGESGEAFGLSKNFGKYDKYYLGKTSVIGAKDSTKFATTEDVISVVKDNKIAQISAGKVSIPKQVYQYKSADFGVTVDDVTDIIGKTVTSKGSKAISYGRIVDINKFQAGDIKVISTGTGAGGGTSFSTTFGGVSTATKLKMAQLSTQSSVRAVVGSEQAISSPLWTASTSALALQTTQATTPVQQPRMLELPAQKEITTTKLAPPQQTQPLKQVTTPRLATETVQATAQIVSPKVTTIQTTRNITPAFFTPPLIEKPLLPFIFKTKQKDFSSGLRQAYTVEVRRQGKFKPLAYNLPKGQAFNIGASNVLRGIGVTFRLRKAGTTRQRDIPFRIPKQIKQKSGKFLTFAELPQFRLDTPTELLALGRARRKKKRR